MMMLVLGRGWNVCDVTASTRVRTHTHTPAVMDWSECKQYKLLTITEYPSTKVSVLSIHQLYVTCMYVCTLYSTCMCVVCVHMPLCMLMHIVCVYGLLVILNVLCFIITFSGFLVNDLDSKHCY